MKCTLARSSALNSSRARGVDLATVEKRRCHRLSELISPGAVYKMESVIST
jgi:hypothetical protein